MKQFSNVLSMIGVITLFLATEQTYAADNTQQALQCLHAAAAHTHTLEYQSLKDFDVLSNATETLAKLDMEEESDRDHAMAQIDIICTGASPHTISELCTLLRYSKKIEITCSAQDKKTIEKFRQLLEDKVIQLTDDKKKVTQKLQAIERQIQDMGKQKKSRAYHQHCQDKGTTRKEINHLENALLELKKAIGDFEAQERDAARPKETPAATRLERKKEQDPIFAALAKAVRDLNQNLSSIHQDEHTDAIMSTDVGTFLTNFFAMPDPDKTIDSFIRKAVAVLTEKNGSFFKTPQEKKSALKKILSFAIPDQSSQFAQDTFITILNNSDRRDIILNAMHALDLTKKYGLFRYERETTDKDLIKIFIDRIASNLGIIHQTTAPTFSMPALDAYSILENMGPYLMGFPIENSDFNSEYLKFLFEEMKFSEDGTPDHKACSQMLSKKTFTPDLLPVSQLLKVIFNKECPWLHKQRLESLLAKLTFNTRKHFSTLTEDQLSNCAQEVYNLLIKTNTTTNSNAANQLLLNTAQSADSYDQELLESASLEKLSSLLASWKTHLTELSKDNPQSTIPITTLKTLLKFTAIWHDSEEQVTIEKRKNQLLFLSYLSKQIMLPNDQQPTTLSLRTLLNEAGKHPIPGTILDIKPHPNIDE